MTLIKKGKKKIKNQLVCLDNEGKDNLVRVHAVSGQAEGTQPCQQPERATPKQTELVHLNGI